MRRRYGRPNFGETLRMVLINAVVAFITLKITFALFGIREILEA